MATTNHPEKLDPALLDRPSRFDRKYHFDLPGAPERAAYAALWNKELQAELGVSAHAVNGVVRATEGFSFAYLKELFLSSMMQWISADGSASMDTIILDQTTRLRRQLNETERTRAASAWRLRPRL